MEVYVVWVTEHFNAKSEMLMAKSSIWINSKHLKMLAEMKLSVCQVILKILLMLNWYKYKI